MRKLPTSLQINHYLENNRPLFNVVKAAISALCLGFISYKLWNTDIVLPAATPGMIGVISVILLLMPVNWFLESEKWRISVPEDRLSATQAFRITLSGLALNWTLPFTSGDALARISVSRNYKKSILALFATRLLMLLITLTFGGFSLVFYYALPTWIAWMIVGVGLTAVTAVYLISRRKQVDTFPLDLVALYSILRYLVFTFQFYLLLDFFNPDLESTLVFLGIGWIFLFRTSIPALFGNFGVREAGALIFFDGLVSNASTVLAPCLLIWVINQVIPSLVGLGWMYGLRWKVA